MVVKRTLAPAGLLGLLALTGPAWAQDTTPTLKQLQQQLEQQRRALDAQSKALERTQQQLERLQIRAQAPANAAPPPAQAPAPSTAAEQPPQQVGKAPVQPQKQQAAEIAPVLEQPGVLTPRGHFVLEPSLQYDYSTNSRVALIGFTVIPAITIGLIDVREVNRTTAIAALTARYGLTNRLEMEVKVPYVYRHDEAVTRPLAENASHDEVFNTTGHGLGDVEFALRYQFNQGGPSFPYFIGSLRGIFPTGDGPFDVKYAPASSAQAGTLLQEELPTGAGFYGVEPGLLVIFPSDPAVFFAGVNYQWNIKRNVDKQIGTTHVGEVDPGDAISLNFGMGLAVNERSSFSIGYQHTYIEKTKFDGDVASDATDTQLGELMFGYAYSLTQDTSLNLTLGAGLTRDTPDVEVIMRVPFAF